MTVASTVLDRWTRKDPRRLLVTRALGVAGYAVERIQELPDEDLAWGLFLRLPAPTAELFGTKREVLLWADFAPALTAQHLHRALQVLARHTPRLSTEVLLFLTGDRTATDEIREAADASESTVVLIGERQLHNVRPLGGTDFVSLLRRAAFSRDLYDLKPPVTRSVDFFGRHTLLEGLRADVRHGQSHLGIFGLRKIGKTSLVNRLRVALRSQGDARVAHIDLQRVVAINPTAEYLLWHLGEALFDDEPRVRRLHGLRLFGRHTVFTDVGDPASVWELFDHDLRIVMRSGGARVVLMLDEIERIYPARANSPWVKDFVRVWQLLRGIDQEDPGALRFVISGTNPQCVEDHAIQGVDNPIYNYFSIRYLGPLARYEGADLLTSYGSRMGLDWSAAATRRAIEDTGGHPALLRTYASMMHKRFLPRSRPVRPDADDAREIANEFLVQQGPLLAQVVAILEDQYRDEFEILNTLALGKVHEFQDLARAFPDDTAHLLGYGLCGSPSKATKLNVDLLQTYLQNRHAASGRLSAGSAAAGLVGRTVDEEYEFLSLLSDHGGYANVYKARRLDGDNQGCFAALKVLRRGQLSVLEREVEVLQRLEHPNIVKVYGSGRLPEGPAYLAMEYLEGTTLREFCTASGRPSEVKLLNWAASLLDALVHMHPRERDIRAMRAASSRSGDVDLQSLLEARYGYVHRDIKPENVMVTERGPVLIDFNISVRASTPVATVSATPGYLPYLPIGEVWSPKVDLHQLGLTLLQVAAGGEYTGTNTEDLRLMATARCAPGTLALIDGLVAAHEKGYQTAFTARRDALAALQRS